ncbi:ester cyclase [Kutzneria kofuensis]|uniref:ester cyclase n=1 Tax=Kutzneria kofuensis TaxID=103725 RepID=UPI0031E59168
MTREQNVQTVRRLLELVNKQEFDRLDEVYAYDLVDHDPAPEHGGGFDGVQRYFADLNSAFPGPAPGGGRDHRRGGPRGAGVPAQRHAARPVHGVAATGHRVETRGMQMSRLADGKIVERWGAVDDLAILGRLNVSVPVMSDGHEVTSVEAAAYTVPTDGPEADGTLSWDATTIVVVTVRTRAGVTGVGHTYGTSAWRA